MKKLTTTLAALVLSPAGAGAAVAATPLAMPKNMLGPAMSVAQCAAEGQKARLWTNVFLADKLAVDGIRYKSITRDDNCFKVALVGPDGKVTSKLFDPATLNLVHRARADL